MSKLKQLLFSLNETDRRVIEEKLKEKDQQIDQLKQQLAEKDIRIEELEGQFAYECECNKQLVEVQKQLEKKQNEIDEINKEFVQAVHDWKTLCAEKDKEIERLNHKLNVEAPCLIRNYKDMLEQLIQSHTQLEQEIEKLKQQYTILENKNGKLAKELIVKNYKKAKKEVSFGIQLAIRELEKVKNFVDGRTYCADYINKRIQELKGE